MREAKWEKEKGKKKKKKKKKREKKERKWKKEEKGNGEAVWKQDNLSLASSARAPLFLLLLTC
jgi:hypothetical protein